MLCASAHIIDVAKKKAVEINRIGFLPHISENFTHTGAAAALANRYAPPIQT
jgi:hypothetical protein